MRGRNSSADPGPGLQEQATQLAPVPAVLAKSVKSRRFGGGASNLTNDLVPIRWAGWFAAGNLGFPARFAHGGGSSPAAYCAMRWAP